MNTIPQIGNAEETLAFYGDLIVSSSEPREDVLTDLLTDLRHYCDDRKLDFNNVLDLSYVHYLEEKA